MVGEKRYMKLKKDNEVIVQAFFTSESLKQIIIDKWKKYYGKGFDKCTIECEEIIEDIGSRFKKGSIVKYPKLHRHPNFKNRFFKNSKCNTI